MERWVLSTWVSRFEAGFCSFWGRGFACFGVAYLVSEPLFFVRVGSADDDRVARGVESGANSSGDDDGLSRGDALYGDVSAFGKDRGGGAARRTAERADARVDSG